jgi:hypothetical protein
MWENATDEVIDVAILVLSEELREIVREKRRKRRSKCRNWIVRRESLGASNCLFRELSSQDPQEYRRHMRMSVEKFDEFLRLVESYTCSSFNFTWFPDPQYAATHWHLLRAEL